MINKLIIGNVISLIGCFLFFISCRLKTQKNICIVQTIECCITGSASLILGGIIGALTTYIAAVRNCLGIWRLNGKICNVCCLLITSVITFVNYDTMWDILPLMATIIYTIALSFKSAKITKVGVIPNAFIWFLYCLHIHAYINCIFNVINIFCCARDLYLKKYDD